MFAKSQLNELAERRKLLVLEADLHRGLIAFERENLRTTLASFATLRERVSAASPLLAAGAAVIGLLGLQQRHKLGGWLSIVPAALRLARWLKRQ